MTALLALALLAAGPPQAFDIRDADGGVVIAADRIVAYDWATHTLTLTPGTRTAVHAAIFGKRAGRTFVAAVGGKEVYRGTWKSVVESASCSTPVIVLDNQAVHPAMPEDEIRIDLGYPGQDFFRGEDSRGDPAIKAAVQEKPAAVPAADDPLTLAACTVGSFSTGRSWFLSVNSAGKAELTIGNGAGAVRREFEVPKDRWAAFRKAVTDEGFFDLAADLGERVPSGSTQTLTVALGDRVRTVKVSFLMNWVGAKDRDRLKEPVRAVRLLAQVRGWFADEGAVDLRKYGQAAIDVVK